ncbi:AAA family ATPase [Pelagibacterium flavum]|uniref:AAA family ATPase n=1 Tax=Pelagibacterium flavum TaxID=2984530 RepID=A0ABY6IPE1_9HYPH|nr:AAA family ATPase [Pelagibacterium sp. YIM 151497]UYQ72486.1 AAA family ATPase [Pelagibacterium sp. YIM 151497]
MPKSSKSTPNSSRPNAIVALPVALIEHVLGRALFKRLKTAEPPTTAVLIKVPSESWCDVLESCLTRQLDRVEIRSFKHSNRSSSRNSAATELLNTLGSGVSTIAISATPATAISEEYHSMTDQVFEIESLDVGVIRKVIRQVTGQRPKGLKQIDLLSVGVHEAMAAIGAGNSAQDCVERLRRVRARKLAPVELSHVPTLSRLPLTIPVREWTDMLMADLARLDAGEIAPSAIRFATLDGPPGTGKSLLAASIAKSSGWKLHSTSVQEWFNAGDGHLGAVTKACANFVEILLSEDRSIGFIEELQSIPDRGRLEAKGRDWWMPVVDGILIQIDRVRHSGKKVLLLGACNHYSLLDPALIRPGRLEMRITVMPPSSHSEAEKFVRFYIGDRLLEPDIQVIVNLAIGATPAKIEAAVRSAEARARQEDRPITLEDVTRIFFSDDGLDDEQIQRLALHEAGHAVVALRLGTAVHSVTIIPYGESAGSTKMHLASRAPTADEVEDMIVIQLAGRATDELFGGGADSGASADLAFATRLLGDARNNWGLYGRLAAREQLFSSSQGASDPSLEDWIETKLRQLMDRSREMVTENETAIRVLAARLVKVKILHAGAIRETIDQTCASPAKD